MKKLLYFLGRLAWLLPLTLLALVTTALIASFQLLAFVLLGEYERARTPAAAPSEHHTYVIDSQGRLCRLRQFSLRRPPVAQVVTGRFTRHGRLLVQQ